MRLKGATVDQPYPGVSHTVIQESTEIESRAPAGKAIERRLSDHIPSRMPSRWMMRMHVRRVHVRRVHVRRMHVWRVWKRMWMGHDPRPAAEESVFSAKPTSSRNLDDRFPEDCGAHRLREEYLSPARASPAHKPAIF